MIEICMAERRWKHFQLFLAPMVVRGVSEKCQVCHCTMTEFRLAWVQWCANAEVFQNPTPLISGLRHVHYFQDTLKISNVFDHQRSTKHMLCSVLQPSVILRWCGLVEIWFSTWRKGPSPLVLIGLETWFILAQPCNNGPHLVQDALFVLCATVG